ncbi:hypothetical protein JMN32_15165 [Fulvivirga sp. 29W222]|uniref:Uncharacterized protein n=1 Tax=Fulvivirga marina TaxID=2494733 RepID=A0A937G3A9_9BACT|nr:hypothetical protein [Fulvivirga marina]MBL6447656.1 hypothetical protein [Fulvivirga marina]
MAHYLTKIDTPVVGVFTKNQNIGYYTASIYKWKLLLKPEKYKQLICNSLKFLVDENRATRANPDNLRTNYYLKKMYQELKDEHIQ